MVKGDEVRIVDGAYQGHVARIVEVDHPWLGVELRDGSLLWLASSICQVIDADSNLLEGVDG